MDSNSVQMVMPQLGAQAQSVQNETISHSSSSQQSVMHPTVTMAQSPLQHQIQAYQQNINTNSAGTVQMVMSELNNQVQMVQNENMSHSSSSQPTLMQNTMTVAQPSLQHVQVIQSPLSSPFFQSVYSPQQQMIFPGNLTLQHTGASPVVQNIAQGPSVQLQTKPQLLDNKVSMNGQTYQIVNAVTKAFTNQAFLSKPLYSSPVSLSSQVSNANQLKQVTSQPQMITAQAPGTIYQPQVFGSFTQLPQNITWAAPGNYQSPTLFPTNSIIIRNQSPDMFLHPSQTAMLMPLASGTAGAPGAYTYAIVPQKQTQIAQKPQQLPQKQPQVSPLTTPKTTKVKHIIAVGTQTSTATDKMKFPIPRTRVRPRGKIPVVLPQNNVSMPLIVPPSPHLTAETSVQVSPAIPTETPTHILPAIPSETPIQVPPAVPSETPIQVPSTVPPETPIQVPPTISTETSVQIPSTIPPETPIQAPTTAPSEPAVSTQTLSSQIKPVTSEINSTISQSKLINSDTPYSVPQLSIKPVIANTSNNIQIAKAIIGKPIAMVSATTVDTTIPMNPIVTLPAFITPVLAPVMSSVEPLISPLPCSTASPLLINTVNIPETKIKNSILEQATQINTNEQTANCKKTLEMDLDESGKNNSLEPIPGSVENEPSSSTVMQNEVAKIQTSTNCENVEAETGTPIIVKNVDLQTDSMFVVQKGDNQADSTTSVESVQQTDFATVVKKLGELTDSLEQRKATVVPFPNKSFEKLSSIPQIVESESLEIVDSVVKTENKSPVLEKDCHAASESKPIEQTNDSLVVPEDEKVSLQIDCKVDVLDDKSEKQLTSSELAIDKDSIKKEHFEISTVSENIENEIVPQWDSKCIISPPHSIIKQKQRLKAVVRPHILTHVIDGFVIYESSEPFPVSRSALMNDSSPPAVPKILDDLKKSNDLEHSDNKRNPDEPTKPDDLEKANEPTKTDNSKYLNEPKKADTQEESEKPKKSDESKVTVGQKKDDEQLKSDDQKSPVKTKKSSDPKKFDEPKTPSKKQPEVAATSVENVPKTPGRRGRKRKEQRSGRGRKKLLPSGDSNNIHIIEHDIEPSVEVDVVKDIPVSVHETVPDDKPAEDQSIVSPKAVAVEDKAVLEQENETIDPISEIDFSQKLPTEWSVEDVCDFVRSIPNYQDYAKEFESLEIDGKSLLLLKVDHIVNHTSMKFGPALKLIALIDDMKEKYSLEV